MKFRLLTLALGLAAALGWGTSAGAAPLAAICPTLGSLNDGTCNEQIIFAADGSITTVPSPWSAW